MIIPSSILAIIGLVCIPEAFTEFKKNLKVGNVYKQIGTFFIFLAVTVGTIYEMILHVENEYCAGNPLFNGNCRQIIGFALVCIVYTAIFFLSCNRYIELKQIHATSKEFTIFWLSVVGIIILAGLGVYC